MLFLKQSTAVDIPIGPFLDESDGKTPETLLTITQPDIRLKKGPAAWAQVNSSQTLSHEENGWYEVSLDATDTNTLGALVVAVHESGALPVWREFTVLPANIYDSLVSGSDYLNVEVAAMATDSLSDEAVSTDAALKIQQALNVSINDVLSPWPTYQHSDMSPYDGAGGLIESGSTTQFTDSLRTEAAGYWLNYVVLFTSGGNAGLTRTVSGFASGVFSLNEATNVAIAANDRYVLLAPVASSVSADISTAGVADAVWDEARSGHLVAGSFGEGVRLAAAAIGASSFLPNALDTVLSEIETKIDTVDTVVDSILVDTAEIGVAGAGLTEAGGTGDQFTAIPWNAAWDAEVQSEVNDGLVAYDAATGTDVSAVETDTQNIQSRLPAALNNGRMVGFTEMIGAGAIAASSFSTAALVAIADELLKRDFSSVTGEANRSMLNSLRKLMNRWAISGVTLSVYKEDDTTVAFTQVVSVDASADPITGLDTS